MRFEFTISHLAMFLDKSPVTIRGWERQKLLQIPRKGESAKRVLDPDDVRAVARWAYKTLRISEARYMLVIDTMTCLRMLEDLKEEE